MAGNVGASQLVYPPDQERLSPADAHQILRQHLEQLSGPWGLTVADAHRLGRQVQVRTYAPNEVILPKGVRAECFGLIVRGQVAVQVAHRSQTRAVAVLLPGSTFGEAMLGEGRISTSVLQSLSRSEIWFLRRADLERLVQQREAQKRSHQTRRAGAWGVAVVLIWLALLALLSQPMSRQVLAILPMSLGQLCQLHGYAVCAEQSWTVASALAPDDERPLVALGALYLNREQLGPAEELLEKALALSPENPETLNNLGLLYAHQGDHRRAIAAFREALELEPGVQATVNNLAHSLHEVKSYQEALEQYQLAQNLGAPQPSIWANMAVAYYESAQLSRAVEAARQALDDEDTQAAAHTILGAVALAEGQPEEAVSHLQRAVVSDAGPGEAYFFLGLAYKSLDQPSKAISSFEAALALAKDEVTRVRIRQHLIELYNRSELEQVD